MDQHALHIYLLWFLFSHLGTEANDIHLKSTPLISFLVSPLSHHPLTFLHRNGWWFHLITQSIVLSSNLIMASGPITSWEIDGETVETVSDFIFLGYKITADGDCSHEIKRHLLLGVSQGYGFSCGHVWMWELDCEEGWAPKNWCFWSVLEKTLESPLDCKEIQPVHSEGDQPWDFFGGNDAKAETPVLWPPHEKSWLIGKDSDAGRDWGQ